MASLKAFIGMVLMILFAIVDAWRWSMILWIVLAIVCFYYAFKG